MIEWIQKIDPELLKIWHVPGHDRQPVYDSRSGNGVKAPGWTDPKRQQELGHCHFRSDSRGCSSRETSKEELESQYIPTDSALRRIDKAEAFWEAKRELLAESFNEYVREARFPEGGSDCR